MESPGRDHIKEDITIKDLILTFRGWVAYLWKKKLVIIIVAAIGAALGLTLAFIKKPTYEAKLTFVLEDSKSNPLGAYAGIASQFGFDLGAGSGSGIFTGDNIMEFLKSRFMIEKSLLTTININNKPQTLAELYVEFNEMREKWDKFPELKDLHFPAGQPRNKFSLQQDSILNVIQDNIVKKDLSVSKPDKKLSFIEVTTVTKNELFSKVFTERLVKEATDFYVQTKTMRSKTNVDKLQATADSLEMLLNKKTYSVAATQDMNMNPARNIAGVTTELQTRQKFVLETMYGEVVKNLELNKLTMAQETPIIQVVDSPIMPLQTKKLGKFKGLVLGGLLFGFLAVAGLIARKTYGEIMR